VSELELNDITEMACGSIEPGRLRSVFEQWTGKYHWVTTQGGEHSSADQPDDQLRSSFWLLSARNLHTNEAPGFALFREGLSKQTHQASIGSDRTVVNGDSGILDSSFSALSQLGKMSGTDALAISLADKLLTSFEKCLMAEGAALLPLALPWISVRLHGFR
jgi:hypothetical protein